MRCLKIFGKTIRVGYYALISLICVLAAVYWASEAVGELSQHIKREHAIQAVIEQTCKPYLDQMNVGIAAGLDADTLMAITSVYNSCKVEVRAAFEKKAPASASAIEYAPPGMQFENWPDDK